MPKKKDITGQRFGRLVATQKIGQRNQKTLWLCQCDCGQEHTTILSNLTSGDTQSCGCRLKEWTTQLGKQFGGLNNASGAASTSWKGGRTTNGKGYIRVYIEPGKYQLEHIMVMEKHLGRALLPEETVHHKYGIRSDNQLENLELWSSNHPSGQRVEDLKTWAKQLLQTYPD